MKRFFLYVALLICMLTTLLVVAGDDHQIRRPSGGGILKSIAPIGSESYAGYIEVIFYSNLGDVDIEVVNEAGEVVDSDKVLAVVNGRVIVSTVLWDAGLHTISVTTSNGVTYSMDFE